MIAVEYDDLIGERLLSGVDFIDPNESPKITLENGHVILLDGRTLCMWEDPDDGYRSHMSRLYECPEIPCKNTFPGVMVEVKRSEKEEYDDSPPDCLELWYRGQIVLKFGTSYSDDYYPCVVWDWRPIVLGTVKTKMMKRVTIEVEANELSHEEFIGLKNDYGLSHLTDTAASAILCSKCTHHGKPWEKDKEAWAQVKFRCYQGDPDHCQLVESTPRACEEWERDR